MAASAAFACAKCWKMTDTKHTPGPWCVDDDGFTIKSLNGIARHPEIAEVFGSDWQENARLIAAAPDLLEFAVMFLGWREYSSNGEFPFDRLAETARAAIAKAEQSQ
jgi:hypothetical protein